MKNSYKIVINLYFLKKFYKHIFYYLFLWGKSNLRDNLTFEDGVLLCKHIYQSAIDKTLHGVIEQEEIFIKAHDMLCKLEHSFNNERLDELLCMLNMENVYAVI